MLKLKLILICMEYLLKDTFFIIAILLCFCLHLLVIIDTAIIVCFYILIFFYHATGVYFLIFNYHGLNFSFLRWWAVEAADVLWNTHDIFPINCV